VALVAIPFITAREPNPMRGLRKALVLFIAFNFVYMVALRFLYSRLS
jgi:hypothetical protein